MQNLAPNKWHNQKLRMHPNKKSMELNKMKRIKPIKILFTSPGRRFELITLFKTNFPAGSLFYGADFEKTSSASYCLDKVFKVPYEINKEYIEKILSLSIENNVAIVIPLIDPELLLFSEYKNRFKENGIFVMISDYSKIEIAIDKWNTFKFVEEINIPTPLTNLPSQIKNLDQINYPVIAKPRKGSASKGIFKIYSKKNFNNLSIDNSYIIQEIIIGDEITVDIFSDGSKKCYEAVQRKRLKIRGGEVERGVTIKDSQILELTKRFVAKYQPLGVINIQFILRNGKPYFIEINPRFGGGYPLSYAAGANYPIMLLNLYKGIKNKISLGEYTDGLYMFRYDNAIYTKDLLALC